MEYEHLRIEARGTDVYFVAIPSLQERTEFRLAPGEGPTFVFENPAHDFPKAIRYAPIGADSLLATISGGGREVPFPYARVGCPGSTGEDTPLRVPRSSWTRGGASRGSPQSVDLRRPLAGPSSVTSR